MCIRDSFKEFGGNAKIKTSTWYIHNVKKKVILAKINNSKVKFISNQWADNKGYGASIKKTKIDSIQMKINNLNFEFGAGTNQEDDSVMIGGLSESGLNKDLDFIKIEKQLNLILKKIETKKKKKQNYEKDFKQYGSLIEKNQNIVNKYSIMQICPPAIKVKKGSKGFDLSNILEIFR